MQEAEPYQSAVADLGRLVSAAGKQTLTSAEIAVAVNHGDCEALDEAIGRLCNIGPAVVRTAQHVGQAMQRMRQSGAAINSRVGGHNNVARWSVSSKSPCHVVNDSAPGMTADDGRTYSEMTESIAPVAESSADRSVSQPTATGSNVTDSLTPGALRNRDTDVAGKPQVAPGSKAGDSDKSIPVNGAPDLGLDPRRDPSLHVPTAPLGYHQRGVSTLVDGNGQPVLQWIKTAIDPAEHRLDLLLDAIKTLADPFAASHDSASAPTHLDSDLLCVYKVPDPHLGLLGWGEEVGRDYDLKIAEELHLKAIRQLAQISPPAKHALVLALGDFLHAEDNLSRTARSGNPLDTDSRFAKVLRVGVRMARAMVDCALAKHELVTVIIEVGNHDDQASIMLATALALIYERDPRVAVDTSPARFHWYRFGRCLIGSTHGSETKAEQLPMIMAHDRPADWGATEHRQFYVGHWHHEAIKEFPGVTVEYCRTLAGRDAWAHGKGYRSARGMRCDIWHREWGMISFNQVGLGQLEAT